MQLHVIHSGLFKLDGGAMFGVVPKVMWKKKQTPDADNYCTWAMRCMLVETEDDRRILIDTGIGDKQDEKFRSHFSPHGSQSLLGSLKEKGFEPEDITDVFLTHFHFDHVGGAVKRENGELKPTFPNARYWSNQKHYDWAYDPNPREKASFLKENFVPLKEQGVLHLIEHKAYDDYSDWESGIQVAFANGHTEAMMLPILKTQGKTVVYCADLIPSVSHIGLPYVMAYDLRPLDTMQEKALLLERAVENDYILFFEHGPTIEACTVKRNDRGRIVVDQKGSLEEVLVKA